MSGPLIVRAPAKINVTLEVLGRRPDAYHEVRMLMAGVSLADELSFEMAGRLSLRCDRPDLDCSEGNLVLKAARALQAALGRRTGAKIFLKKRIPLGGGLAGGSTDAAATLKGLNQLWSGGLGQRELGRIAATLGSDVPFCLCSGWAYATGRGERIEALALRRRLHLVLVNPGFEVSTPWVYSHLGALSPSRRNVSQAAFEAIQTRDLAGLKKSAINDLEKVTAARYAEIGQLERVLLTAGALMSRMSGSGPTVWGLFVDANAAKKACEIMNKKNIQAYAVHTIARMSA